MTKIALKVEKHYGNKDLKVIMENLIAMKISNLKFNNETKDKSYNNMGTDTAAINKGGLGCE